MDQNELVNKRVHAIAKAHRCSIDDVHTALDRHPIELDRDAYLKRTLALELMRLPEDLAHGRTGADNPRQRGVQRPVVMMVVLHA
jgi:hypothetical protein